MPMHLQHVRAYAVFFVILYTIFMKQINDDDDNAAAIQAIRAS